MSKSGLYYFFFCLLFAVGAAIAQDEDGYKKFYFPNGRVSSEGNIEKGKPNGYWKNYHENGLLKSEGNRINFQLDGVWKFYNESGILTVEYDYKNGKKDGFKRVYDPETRNLISEEAYSNDVRNGMSYYYKEDYRYKEVPFVNGKEEGKGKEYTREGLIQTITLYKNGFINKEEKINRTDKFNKKQGIWKEFYPTGMVKREVKYRDDKLDGYLKEFAPDGNLTKAEKYVDGVLIVNAAELIKLDVKNTYYESGKIKSSGTFHEGVPEGYTRQFDEEGKITGSQLFTKGYLIGEGVYDEKGLKQGLWKEYYLTGQLKGEGMFQDDKRTGEWIYYYPSGKVEQKGKYNSQGKPVGEWKWWYESGNLLRVETFLKGLPDGEMTEYDDSLNVITKGSFLDGLKEGEWMYIEGDEKTVGEYRNGEKTGIWKTLYTGNNRLALQENYVDGLENGKYTRYHYNGKVWEEGVFLMGNKDGTWRKYNTEGVLEITFFFDNGLELKVDGAKLPDLEAIEGK
jgi:uncharacterized protein